MEFRKRMSIISRVLAAIRSSDASQPFQRLVPFNWGGEFLVIYLGMLASFLVAGFWCPYWRIADMDFWTVYNALLLNDPLPQEFFDHPGYLSILLLSYWLRALHALGIVQVISLSEIPPLSDPAGFAHAWTAATQAGRVLSLIYAMGFVLAFSYLLRVAGARLARRRIRQLSVGVLGRHGDGNAHHAHRIAARRIFHVRSAHADHRRDVGRAMVAACRRRFGKLADHTGNAEQDSVLVSDLCSANPSVAVR
jgi:hypothetical protein